MKLDEFISNVDKGLHSAKGKTSREYSVGVTESDGVDFDIAVTVTSTADAQIEGRAKAGFIQVLGADVGTKLGAKDENSQVNRIRFTVHVPEHRS